METGAKPAAAAGGGAARVLVAQVLLVEGSGSAHAIAVHAAASDGKYLVLRTHDQLFQERGKYTVRCGAQSKRKGFALPSCLAGRLADALRRHRQDHPSRPCIVRTLIFVG